MIAVLTGDLINSRDIAAVHWMPLLKGALAEYGSEPNTWEICRGDSFQLETKAQKAL